MTYDFKEELKKQELENPKDILYICGEGQVTLRKTTDRSSITQQEYTAISGVMERWWWWINNSYNTYRVHL